MAFFEKIKSVFRKTSEKVSFSIGKKKIDENVVQEIEEALIMADVGIETSVELASKVASRKFLKGTSELEVQRFLANEVCSMLKPYEGDFFQKNPAHNPEIMLIIGVNGNGKTTTVAKIAYVLTHSGRRPLLVAADTFRAAATDQLKYWAKKISVDVHFGREKADVAGLVYDALKLALAEGHDAVLIDTAGRMQNRGDLLDELEKMKRVIKKLNPSAPHRTILVLDGFTGQAVHNQVDVFLNRIGIDGIIVTKLDGTAKGGAIIPLVRKYCVPVFAIGIGEGLDDLKPFDAKTYADAIFGLESANQRYDA
ncbi:MAG: signal recognition particle-docking protein FtsY [Holosporaceae bacterium]|jgi:fused signal recognition particle receptor|nr:signal recognition particle-docking protein FtsY [Holosporaceae bacterium]